MIDLDADVDLAQVQRVLAALRSEWPSSRYMGRVAALTLRQQVQHLAGGDERDPTTGSPWARWSEAYVAAGAPFGGDHRLLLRSQDLLNSLKEGVVTDMRATVGTDQAYARIHQEGWSGVTGKIPARPYMGVGDDDLDELEILTVAFVDRIVQRAA